VTLCAVAGGLVALCCGLPLCGLGGWPAGPVWQPMRAWEGVLVLGVETSRVGAKEFEADGADSTRS
jgi:hypothetical protein